MGRGKVTRDIGGKKGGAREGGLTACLDKGLVVLRGEERVGEVPEELLQQTRDTIDVVEEVLRVPEVEHRVGRI